MNLSGVFKAEEVRKQLEEVSVSRVNIDVGLTVIKNPSANWIISAWQSIQHRPQLALKKQES